MKSRLLEEGIPVGTYESSEADPNEFNEVQVREDIEGFLESLGLKKIMTEKNNQLSQEEEV